MVGLQSNKVPRRPSRSQQEPYRMRLPLPLVIDFTQEKPLSRWSSPIQGVRALIRQIQGLCSSAFVCGKTIAIPIHQSGKFQQHPFHHPQQYRRRYEPAESSNNNPFSQPQRGCAKIARGATPGQPLTNNKSTLKGLRNNSPLRAPFRVGWGVVFSHSCGFTTGYGCISLTGFDADKGGSLPQFHRI